MEELVKKIDEILNQYFIECRGNRLNQFSFATLKNTILNEIRNYKQIKNEVKEDVKK